MRKLFAAFGTLFCAATVTPAVTLSAAALPQSASQSPSQSQGQNDSKPELMDIRGTVRSDNAKITFVADEGGKSWDVLNPEALRDHVDQHIQVNANVYSDKGQIHVVSIVTL